jgi:hypothetical protein
LVSDDLFESGVKDSYLEVGQAKATSAAGKDGHGGASLASTSGDHVAVSRGSIGNHAEVGLDSRASRVVDVERSSRGKLIELDTTRARHGEAGGLELGLLGEEEDDAALLAGVARGDVEVKDGAVAGAQVGKVLSSVGGAGHVLVDGDDGVRGLVGTTGRSAAGSRGRHRGWRCRGCRLGSGGGRRSWHRGRRSRGRRGRGRRSRASGHRAGAGGHRSRSTGHTTTVGCNAVGRAASDVDGGGLVDSGRSSWRHRGGRSR